LAADGLGKRDLIFAQAAFYAGERATLKVLNHLLEHGKDEELRRTLQRHGRQIKALQGLRPRARRH
jgi:ribosomal protein S15P/S13E